LDLTPDELERLRKALDNYNAYLRSQNRGDTISLQLAERLRDVA
jgi:hypothetical protein